MMQSDQDIYAKMKDCRKRQGLTLKDLSARTGFSVSYLSQVERGKSAITLVSIKRIGEVLGLSMSELFAEPEVSEKFVGNGHTHLLTGLQRNYDEFSILSGRFEGRKMECLLLKMAPDHVNAEESAHEGEELYYVVKGKATAIVDGLELTAGEGEVLHFPSSRPHKIVNRSDVELEMFSVVIPTIF
jgi:transcriptional regulator with XRE-family HTH domain